MEIKSLRILTLEIFKTLNNLNPSYLTEMLQKLVSRQADHQI